MVAIDPFIIHQFRRHQNIDARQSWLYTHPSCSVAILDRPYQPDYSFSYGGQTQHHHTTDEGAQAMTHADYQQLFPPNYQHSQVYANPQQEYHQHAVVSLVPAPPTSVDSSFEIDQSQLAAQHMQHRRMSQVSSQYATPYDSPEMMRSYQLSSQGSRERSHSDDYSSFEYSGIQHIPSHPGTSGALTIDVAPAVQSAQLQPTPYMYQVPSQRRSPPPAHSPFHHGLASTQHHHHRLPHQPGPLKMQRTGYGPDSDQDDDHGPPSVVGQPGMPMPASRPKGPKLKFTSDDDQLLVDLKENKNLTWKQIADFFPGRSSGTLQVQRLRIAIEEYDNDRWRIISGKVGNGFTPSACKDKAAELNGEDISDVETIGRDDAPLSATDSALEVSYSMGSFTRDTYDREGGAHVIAIGLRCEHENAEWIMDLFAGVLVLLQRGLRDAADRSASLCPAYFATEILDALWNEHKSGDGMGLLVGSQRAKSCSVHFNLTCIVFLPGSTTVPLYTPRHLKQCKRPPRSGSSSSQSLAKLLRFFSRSTELSTSLPLIPVIMLMADHRVKGQHILAFVHFRHGQGSRQFCHNEICFGWWTTTYQGVKFVDMPP
nr:hypothetical protein CFP56_03959 [Quercus suber]